MFFKIYLKIVFLWHFICLHWQHLLSYLPFINFYMPQTPGKDFITSLQEHVYYVTLLYNLVFLKLKKGLDCFALLICLTIIPLSQITWFLYVRGIPYCFIILSLFLYIVCVCSMFLFCCKFIILQVLVIIEYF